MLSDIQGILLHGFIQMGKAFCVYPESLVRSILTKVMQDNGKLPKSLQI